MLGILAFIIIADFSLLQIAEKKSTELREWVEHTYRVIQKSEAFLGHLRDSETGQRGFLLTNQSKGIVTLTRW